MYDEMRASKGNIMAIDGTYNVVGEVKGRQLHGTIELETKGATLTGMAHVRGIDAPIENGKVDGNKLAGTVAAPTPLGNLKFKVKAEVDGDVISGTLKALLISAKFTGTRAA